jgi:hypothetical protein
VRHFGLSWIPLTHLVVLAVLVTLAGVGGDLAESLLKRWAGVKDSGALFPGHGGMLDRSTACCWARPSCTITFSTRGETAPFRGRSRLSRVLSEPGRVKRGLSILGSTGSVGCNVLRIVDAFPDRFEVVGLAAGGNVDRLAEQVARYRPRVVSVASEEARAQLAQRTDVSGCASA